MAPLDVRLNASTEDNTVVQPDLMVICDRSKIKKGSCAGAPDLVIEILSDSNTTLDKVIKYKKYRQAGVREYWIVDADSRSIMVNNLVDGKYMNTFYCDNEVIPVTILPGLEIGLESVFAGIDTEEP